MNSFHSDPKIKEKYLSRVRAHAAADEIIKGKYWVEGKGCAVGCTVHSSDHSAYESELGIPRILARLEDGIFEALRNELAMTWPARFLESVPVGADLSMIWPKFVIWMLTDSEFGVIRFAKKEKTKESILKVAELYKKKVNGEEVAVEDWKAAASAPSAYADADDADDAYAAASADAAAAYAYAAAAASAARKKCRIAQSEKLLELLREAK